MEIKVLTGKIEENKAGVIIVSIFEAETQLSGVLTTIDKALDGAVVQLMSQGEIKGNLNEITLIHSMGKLPAARVIILGLGKRGEVTKDKIRAAAAAVLRFARQKRIPDVASIALGSISNSIKEADSAQAITEGCLLGTYGFRKHKTGEPDYPEIKQLFIVEDDAAKISELEDGCRLGRIQAEAAILARDMVNEPGNYMTPTDMANTAKTLAEQYGLKINIFDSQHMHELGMGALLGVSQGSDQPPKFIVLRYQGNESEKIDIGLVGKGITFDSGGISIKPSEGMEDMKGDMAGGAAVIAVITAVARLKLNINIIAVVPATENMPGGRSFKPGDVLTAMNGKTIEVISTDAEGRLILADALSYIKTFPVSRIIDVATLTGACHIALGDICTGVFGNNQELVDKIIEAGKNSGEKMWQLPMFEEYKEYNKSEVADIKNHGGRYGGAILAAQFLAEFAGDTPWVHLDIAGTSDTTKERGYLLKGATGVPVRTLIDLIISVTK